MASAEIMRDRPVQRYNKVCHSEKRLLSILNDKMIIRKSRFSLLVLIVLGVAWLDPSCIFVNRVVGHGSLPLHNAFAAKTSPLLPASQPDYPPRPAPRSCCGATGANLFQLG